MLARVATAHSIPARHAARKPLRMQGWDFRSPAWYFLTTNTKNMRPVFGAVVNGRMVLNDAGRIAEKYWHEIPAHFPHAVVDEFIVLPNHIHGLLQLVRSTAPGDRKLEAFGKPVAGSIPTIIRSYKAAVSKALGESIWQSRFYEVRARDEAARANIRRYIRENPQNYTIVHAPEDPAMLGDPELLRLPKMGFLASRGETTLRGKLPLTRNEAIISGFLSPMERAVFRAGLAHRRPMIWVLPSGMGQFHPPTACCGAIEEGRLLVLSPFADDVEAPNSRRAAWCNHYVVTHCDRLS